MQRRHSLSFTSFGWDESHVFSAFLGQFGFWDVIWVARWNGPDFVILKHMKKDKSDFLSRNKIKIEKSTFILETHCM